MRPIFLGHAIVEILLDAVLIEQDRSQLDRYYQALGQIDSALVADAVGSITGVNMMLLQKSMS